MKTLVILYSLISFSSLFIMFMFLNVYYFNISSNPMNYLIFVIYFTVLISVIVFVNKPNLLIFMYMILMIMISGMTVILSYFVSMINLVKSMSKKFILLYMMFYMYTFIISFCFYIINKPLINKNFNLMTEYTFCLMTKMFLYPNYYIFIMIILFMFLMIFVCSMMCFSKKMSLRSKKM